MQYIHYQVLFLDCFIVLFPETTTFFLVDDRSNCEPWKRRNTLFQLVYNIAIAMLTVIDISSRHSALLWL